MISLRNVTQNNLNIPQLSIPKNKLVVVIGVSGSGKSSLVYNTICQEAQRQWYDTMSSFARQRLPKLSRPEVDSIQGLSPALVVNQSKLSGNTRSTVGTFSETLSFLKILFSRYGSIPDIPAFQFGYNHPEGACSDCSGIGQSFLLDIDMLFDDSLSLRQGAIVHSDYNTSSWFFKPFELSKNFDMDKPLKDFTEKEMDCLLNAPPTKIPLDHFSITFEGLIPSLTRRYLSGNRKTKKNMEYFKLKDCNSCHGERLNEKSRKSTLSGYRLPSLCDIEIKDIPSWLESVQKDYPLSKPIVQPLIERIHSICDLGIGYLTLARTSSSLSGGEAQRLKISKQLNCDLVNLLYILDEPSVGLHSQDLLSMVQSLKKIRDKGNSVILVEHDPQMIKEADHIIEIGPHSGENGGKVIFQGSFEDFIQGNTINSKVIQEYEQLCAGGFSSLLIQKNNSNSLENQKSKASNSLPSTDLMFFQPSRNRQPANKDAFYKTFKSSIHNLVDFSCDVPKGLFTCITGVPGSGKSSFINGIFMKQYPDCVFLDQSPVSRSSRSNCLTFTDIFTDIRKLFAAQNKVSASLFSFNSSGACSECKGAGEVQIEMSFLGTTSKPCDHCSGNRYQPSVLQYKYKDFNIAEFFQLTIDKAISLFNDQPRIYSTLQLLSRVGLGYLRLGQTLTSLSGGEAQRIKLSKHLGQKGQIYIFDEPTSGLSAIDIKILLDVFQDLVDDGNTLIVIEHNVQVILAADWVIDLGPGGGKNGGKIMSFGPLSSLIEVDCPTGRILKPFFSSPDPPLKRVCN